MTEAKMSQIRPFAASQKGVFLDRDGTLIKEKHYLHDPNEIEFEPGVIDGLAQLQAAGYLLIIVTNQSGIGRGYFTEADFWAVQAKLNEDLQGHGITLKATYFSPYHPTHGIGPYKKDSPCRKPNPGMLIQAIHDYGIDPSVSFIIGDKQSDVRAGQTAGVTPILVETGYGALERQAHVSPHSSVLTVPDFATATHAILTWNK